MTARMAFTAAIHRIGVSRAVRPAMNFPDVTAGTERLLDRLTLTVPESVSATVRRREAIWGIASPR
jgi:hypothetical protein